MHSYFIRATIWIGLVLAFAAGSAANAATDPAGACKASKAKAAGGKASALLKAFGNNARRANPGRFLTTLSKAQAKFTRAFERAEAKGGCLTVGDVGAIESKVDAFVTDTANSTGRVGGEFQVNTYTERDQANSDVGVAANGDFVAAWVSDKQDGDGAGVFGQRYDSTGAAAGGEFQVNSYTTSAQFGPAVGVGANGDFVVTWQGHDQDAQGVFAQRYDSAGAEVGSMFQVNTYTTGYQSYPAASANADGSFIVVWRSGGDQDGDGAGVFGQRYDSMGMAVGVEFQINTYTTGAQTDPAVDAAADGSFVVVWASEDQDGDLQGVFGQRYDDTGTAVGGEFAINTYTTSAQFDPDVGMAADGTFVVVWTSYGQDGDELGVFGQAYDSAGGLLGAEFPVNAQAMGDQHAAGVGVGATGDSFVIVWTGYNDVFGRRFNGSGEAMAPEFRVNTYTPNFQDEPAVSAAANGDFVVVWTSQLQDGEIDGVFGQRFAK